MSEKPHATRPLYTFKLQGKDAISFPGEVPLKKRTVRVADGPREGYQFILTVDDAGQYESFQVQRGEVHKAGKGTGITQVTLY
ncbi:hypothetical protein K2P56_04645 [Patescibacteria group bacterium]|nr:hypothetical protein [Patescibacteria group bacterium]